MTTRTLYIDPGTARTAWVIAERADPAQALPYPLRCIDHATIETGTLVPRPPERVTSYIRKSDGVEVVQDTERVVTAADRRRVGDALVEIAQRHGVTRAVVEMMGRVHLHGSPAAQWAQAESARQVGKVEELILDRLEAAGVEVVTTSSTKWRARLRIFLPAKVVGSPSWSRRDLLPILQTGYDGGWPTTAGEDERDAGGMSLWDVLPPIVKARKERTGTRRKVKRETWIVRVGALYLANVDDAALSEDSRDALRFATEAGALVATIGLAGASAHPSDSVPRGPRGAIDKAKQKARRIELREARRAEHEAGVLAARVAAGCSCGTVRGRHRRACPLHRGSPTGPMRTAEQTKARAAARSARRARLEAHDRACGD